MELEAGENSSLVEALKHQGRVIFALMLRGMKTRFFGSGLGYVLAVAWPLVHILIIVLLFALRNRVAPYGESTALFVATGAIPFMIFSYISRFMTSSTLSAKPLLCFPLVKITDVLFSCALLEVFSSILVVFILAVIGLIFGVNIWPEDQLELFCATIAAVLLGVGWGFINTTIALIYPLWGTVAVLVTIILWATSGVFFVPDMLPENLRIISAYNPTLQIIEWTRSSYYEDYGHQVLDREYVLCFSIYLIFFSLLLEKILRKYVRI